MLHLLLAAVFGYCGYPRGGRGGVRGVHRVQLECTVASTFDWRALFACCCGCFVVVVVFDVVVACVVVAVKHKLAVFRPAYAAR